MLCACPSCYFTACTGLGYVAASRVRSIDGFYLLEPITHDTLKLKWCGQLKFVNAMMEWQRLCRIAVPSPFPPPEPYPTPPMPTNSPPAKAATCAPHSPKTAAQPPKPPPPPAVAPDINVPLVPFPPHPTPFPVLSVLGGA